MTRRMSHLLLGWEGDPPLPSPLHRAVVREITACCRVGRNERGAGQVPRLIKQPRASALGIPPLGLDPNGFAARTSPRNTLPFLGSNQDSPDPESSRPGRHFRHLLGFGHLLSIGARFPAGVCPLMPENYGKTTAVETSSGGKDLPAKKVADQFLVPTLQPSLKRLGVKRQVAGAAHLRAHPEDGNWWYSSAPWPQIPAMPGRQCRDRGQLARGRCSSRPTCSSASSGAGSWPPLTASLDRAPDRRHHIPRGGQEVRPRTVSNFRRSLARRRSDGART
jgi:hypothetical protein